MHERFGGMEMPEITLETLAQRVAELERKMATMTAVVPPTTDWRSVVGMFEGSEFMRQMDAEIEAMRATEQREVESGGDR